MNGVRGQVEGRRSDEWSEGTGGGEEGVRSGVRGQVERRRE